MAAIGLMGGTFDPIHYGHLILAQQAWQKLELDKVVFVTSPNPPNKVEQVLTDARDRHEMVRLAVRENDRFECSTIEIERGGVSYTIDTIRQLKRQLEVGSHIHLLLGADEAKMLMTWRDPKGIAELADIVVANRPGHPVAEALENLSADLAERIIRLQIPGVDISSSDIRARVARGESITYLVPPEVEKYIVREGLYRERK